MLNNIFKLPKEGISEFQTVSVELTIMRSKKKRSKET